MQKQPMQMDEFMEEQATQVDSAAVNESSVDESIAKNKKKKIKRTVWTVLLALLIFFSGMMTGWFLLEPEFRSLIKTKIAIDNFYYEDVEDDVFFGAIFDAVNGEVLDKYSYYMTADELKEFNSVGEGNRSGIGVVFLTKDAEGNAQMYVTRVCGNSPAEKSGIEAGDYVLGFGKSQTAMIESVVFAEFSAFLQELDTSETFYLKVRKGAEADAPMKILAISKENYVENYVFYRTATASYGFEGEKALTMVEKGKPLTCLDAQTAYIQLVEFNGAAAEEFKQAMDKFRADGMKNLVLDLRGNGGGFLDIMQDIASYFCKNTKEKRPIVVKADYGEYQQNFKAKGNYYDDYFVQEGRICVLADCDTASASECLIGSMFDYGAISYGDICLTERSGVIRTFGKGIMQSTYPLLLGGDAIKLTTAVIRWPISNHCIHGRGVLPEDGALSVAETGDGDAEIAQSIAKLFS